jgi:heterogeneous nuclear ribonucleoprotein A1/A3
MSGGKGKVKTPSVQQQMAQMQALRPKDIALPMGQPGTGPALPQNPGGMGSPATGMGLQAPSWAQPPQYGPGGGGSFPRMPQTGAPGGWSGGGMGGGMGPMAGTPAHGQMPPGGGKAAGGMRPGMGSGMPPGMGGQMGSGMPAFPTGLPAPRTGSWNMPWWGQQAPNVGAAMLQQQNPEAYAAMQAAGQGGPPASQAAPAAAAASAGGAGAPYSAGKGGGQWRGPEDWQSYRMWIDAGTPSQEEWFRSGSGYIPAGSG